MATLNLSNEELKKLTKLIFLGEWMTNAFKPLQQVDVFDDIEQKVYQLVAEAGISNIVEYDDKEESYFITEDFDDECMQIAEDYEDKAFWTELLSRLADRDLLEKLSTIDMNNVDEMVLLQKKNEIIEKYESEFEKNGLDNLVIQK